jgi:hypothetical protein
MVGVGVAVGVVVSVGVGVGVAVGTTHVSKIWQLEHWPRGCPSGRKWHDLQST